MFNQSNVIDKYTAQKLCFLSQLQPIGTRKLLHYNLHCASTIHYPAISFLSKKCSTFPHR